MIKIKNLLLFTLLFTVYSSTSVHAKVSDAEFKAITTDHQIQFQKKHPGVHPHYFRLEEATNVGHSTSSTSPKDLFLVTTGKELKAQRDNFSSYFRAHPEVTLLLDVKKNDGYVKAQEKLAGNQFKLSQHGIPLNLKKLWISNQMQDITSIGNYFLDGCSSLTSLDLPPLSKLTSIENFFLGRCSSLTSLDLLPLNKLTSIGNRFLSDCSSLTSLDLSPLSKLTSIGNLFLSDCSSLTSLDLSPLSKLTSIGNRFLSDCSSLTSLDLSPLSQVTSIGNYFLRGCSSLTSLDLSPLSKLTSIGNDFLSYCYRLTSLDLSPLSQVTSIGNYFLGGCSSLTSLDLSPLSQVTSVGSDFLSYCYRLTSLDLSPLSELTSIGDYFLARCTALTSLDLSPLSQVTSIGNNFLSFCSNLMSLNLSLLNQVTSIEKRFLDGCYKLIKILKPELTNKRILKKLVRLLRESNNPLQQQEGARLYQTYLLKIPENLKEIMAQLNLDMIKAMTPKALPDIKDMSPQDVVDRFDKIATTFDSFVAAYNEKQSSNAAKLTSEKATYDRYLNPQIRNLFIDQTVRIMWPIPDDQRMEMKIGFKHMVKKFEELCTSDRGKAEALTYFNMLCKAFINCESRYVSELNNVLLQMDIAQEMPIQGIEGEIWKILNDFKTTAFQSYIRSDDTDGAHSYGRKFTVVNNAVALPVAVRSFKERISRLSDKEMKEKLAEFLETYFNKDSILEDLYPRLSADDSSLTPKALRAFLGQKEDGKLVMALSDDGMNIDAYHRHWAGLQESEEFDYSKTAFTKGELTRLLELMDVFNPEKSPEKIKAELGFIEANENNKMG